MFGYDDIDLPFILFPRLNLDKDTADSDLGYLFETVRYEEPDCDLDHPFLVGPRIVLHTLPCVSSLEIRGLWMRVSIGFGRNIRDLRTIIT